MDTHHSSSSKHGVKRAAEDELEGEQRLAKRFNLLNLEHKGKLWINPADALHPPRLEPVHDPTTNRAEDDFMQVEDTKDRIYIHNLDQELAEVDHEPDETRILFIPDIERHLSRIPKHILRGGEAPDPSYQYPTGNELVLYTVPSSLSVPPEQDNVRRAILESRARSRQEHETISQTGFSGGHTDPAGSPTGNVSGYDGDDEAMEIE